MKYTVIFTEVVNSHNNIRIIKYARVEMEPTQILKEYPDAELIFEGWSKLEGEK